MQSSKTDAVDLLYQDADNIPSGTDTINVTTIELMVSAIVFGNFFYL